MAGPMDERVRSRAAAAISLSIAGALAACAGAPWMAESRSATRWRLPPRIQTDSEAPDAQEEASTSVTWFANDMLFPHPLADPRAPFAGSRLQFHDDGSTRIENAFGVEQSIFRTGGEEHAFEVGVEGGAFSRFNFDENLDMDGVDFRVGFPLVYRSGRLAVKLEPWHLTSHLGDEFIERTGRERIAYARNAIALGVAVDLGEVWRVYGEAGYGVDIGSLNEPWRAMAGVEWVDDVLAARWFDLFAAVNATTFEEIDWSANFNLQTGIWIKPEGAHTTVRVGLEYYNGHSALTQFFQEREEYLGFGFWFHF